MQILRPNFHRLGAGKNARAPANALEQTPTVGSAAVLGRINVTTDPTTRFDHTNPAPEHSPAGGGQECPRSRQRVRTNTGVGSAAVPGRINPTTDPTTGFDRANPEPEHSPAWDAQTTCLSPYPTVERCALNVVR